MSIPELYDILNVSDGNEKIKYVAVVLTISITMTTYLSPYIGISHLFTLSLITSILPIIYMTWQNSTSTFIKNMDFKLATLDPDSKYEYLYTDANLINLLFSIYNFKSFAPEKFEQIISESNTLLGLRSDFDTGELVNPGRQYLVAEVLCRKILNDFHSFIYVVPDSGNYKLFDKAFRRMRIILRRQLDGMVQFSLKEPLTAHKTFIRPADQPKPFDPDLTDSLFL